MRTLVAILSALSLVTFCAVAQKTPKTPSLRTPSDIQLHPLRPPTVAELEVAVRVMKTDSRWPANGRIVSLDLRQPDKHAILREMHDSVTNRSPRNVSAIPREMFAVVHDAENKRVFEVVVDVTSESVSEVRRLDGVQPMIYTDDMDTVMSLLRANERWKNAIARRGLADSNIAIDVWASGVPTSAFSDRMARALAFVKQNGVNAYDQPIEGLAALVNISRRIVLEVLDRPIVPLPEPNMFMRETLLRDKDRKSTGRISEGENGNVNATRNVNTTRNVNAKRNARTGRNAPAKNASIQTDGSLVEWGPWSFRYLMHQREGLTIYTLSYNSNNIARNGNQRIANGARSIAYRMSVSEMVVPYGDTASHWIWRSAFDVGEYGIGMLAAPLVRGKDVPSNAFMTGLPAVASNGDVSYRENIVAIYEADAGLAWKHYDVMSGAHMEERGRELVITQTSTIGNYDYALSWIFNLNGTITFDAALSGILLTKGTQDTVYAGSEGNQKLAHLIAKNLLAPSHQHFFNVRLDMDIDDTANVVSEVDMVRRPVGKENPFGNAIMMDDWEFRYEKEATTNSNADAGRSWKIASTKTSSIGIPTAYTLHPNDGPPSFLDASNLARRRASFLIHDLWVTRYRENELFGAGDYPNQSSGDDGLPKYILNNESILRKDVVLWYTFNVTHFARPEDWPIMPAVHTGFKILPTGFFTQNPTVRQNDVSGQK
ncbi:MAG: hypothetical protein SGJ05_05895 [bacterium]|nr:hypothetical protein [bacterium]